MAYGLEYRGYYVTEAGAVTREVQILADGYSGEVKTIHAFSEPVLSWDGSDKKQATVIGCECRLTFLSTDTFNADTLFHENPRHYKVFVIDGSTMLFAGWLQGDLAKDIYAADTFTRLFEVSATDGLGDLSDIDIKAVDGSIFIERESVRAFLGYALNLTGLELNLVTAVDYFDSFMSGDANMLNQITVDPRLWIEDEKTISTKEVLERFCRQHYCRLFQRWGKWHFVCIDNQIDAVIPAYEYTSAGSQVTATTEFSHRKEIDTNPVGKTQAEIDDLIVSINDPLKKSRQRPLRRFEVNYDFGPAKSEINGDFFAGSTEGWTFHGSITHDTFSIDNSIASYGLELTGATDTNAFTKGYPQFSQVADHLVTSSNLPFDDQWAATYMEVKKSEKINLSFEYRAPYHRGLKICVAFVYKDNDGVIKTTSNIYDDLSTIARNGLGSDGKWYAWEKVTGGRGIRHLLIPNTTKGTDGSEIIKSQWEEYTISSSDGVPADGWVVLYIYRGGNLSSESNGVAARYRNIKLTRDGYEDTRNTLTVVVENQNVPVGGAKESIDINNGEPRSVYNYSYLARLNGSKTTELWDRDGINPLGPLQAVIGAMYIRQYSRHVVMLEGTLRADELYMGDTLTLSGYDGKVFLITRLRNLTKQDHYEVTLVELISDPIEPRYYTKTGTRLTAFFGGFSNVFSPYFKYDPSTISNKRQGVEDSVGGEPVKSGDIIGQVEAEFFDPDFSPLESPTEDPDTGEDVVMGLTINGKGIVPPDTFPTFRKVKRNWRRHAVPLTNGTDLDSLFIAVPTNLGNYLYLNGTDYYRVLAIENMTNIPEEVQGQAYVIVDTADKFGRQHMIIPSTGQLFHRSKLEDGTITDWFEIGQSTNIPQENVVNLVADLLDIINRIFSLEEAEYLLAQTVQQNSTQINVLSQINNQQDVIISSIQAALNSLSGSFGNYALKSQFDGGVLGATLIKDGPDNQSFSFKRAHGVELAVTTVKQAKIGEAYGFNIPIADFLLPEFVWSPVRVQFNSDPDSWVQYNYTQNGGITFWGTPLAEGTDSVVVYILCNGYVSTYVYYFKAVATISAVSNLTAVITENYDPVVRVSWVYEGDAVTGFNVYRRENGGTWTVITSVSGSTFTLDDDSVNYDKQYDYYIKPYTGGVEGTASNIVSVQTLPELGSGGLYGRYYQNRDLSGSPFDSRVDEIIAFDWSGIEPLTGLGSQNFSVRETGYLRFPFSGQVKLRTRSDDGIRVWVDGLQVVDKWNDSSIESGIYSWTSTLVADTDKPITIEYYQGGGNAGLYLEYETSGGVWATVPSGYLVPEDVAGESLAAPVITSAVSTGENSVNIDWTYSGDVDTFVFQRALTSAGLWINAGAFDTADRTADFTGLTKGTRYYWRVIVNYQGRSSAYSNIISVVTDTDVVAPPDDEAGDIIAAPYDPNALSVGWNSPSLNYSNMSESDELVSIAREAGVDFAVIYPNWWEMEQSENSFNFDNLWWQILKQAERGLGFAVALPSMFPYVPPANSNPFNGWGMASGNSQKRWNGSAWTDSGFISASSAAYLPYTCAIMTRAQTMSNGIGGVGYMLDSVNGAMGSMASGPFVYALRRLAAKLSDWIESKPEIKAICHGIGYFDGGSTESAFTYYDRSVNFWDGDLQNPITAESFQDGDYNNDFKVGFGEWLSTVRYPNLAAFQSAWSTSLDFSSAALYGFLYAPPIYDASGNTATLAYNSSRKTRDWFDYIVYRKKQLYAQVVAAIKNPSSVISGLANPSVKLPTIGYLTESLTAAQGLTAGSAALDMLESFDEIWSSSGSNDGSRIDDGSGLPGGSHLGAFAFRAASMRGTYPGKNFRQELDTDINVYADGGRVGPAKTMAATIPQGATGFMVTFFRSVSDWNDTSYRAENGETVSFKEDLKRGVLAHIRGKSRTLPSPIATLSYNREQMFDNPYNPNGVVRDWLVRTNPNAAGITNIFIDVKCNP